jgi:hypothetical protein
MGGIEVGGLWRGISSGWVAFMLIDREFNVNVALIFDKCCRKWTESHS